MTWRRSNKKHKKSHPFFLEFCILSMYEIRNRQMPNTHSQSTLIWQEKKNGSVIWEYYIQALNSISKFNRWIVNWCGMWKCNSFLVSKVSGKPIKMDFVWIALKISRPSHFSLHSLLLFVPDFDSNSTITHKVPAERKRIYKVDASYRPITLLYNERSHPCICLLHPINFPFGKSLFEFGQKFLHVYTQFAWNNKQ